MCAAKLHKLLGKLDEVVSVTRDDHSAFACSIVELNVIRSPVPPPFERVGHIESQPLSDMSNSRRLVLVKVEAHDAYMEERNASGTCRSSASMRVSIACSCSWA